MFSLNRLLQTIYNGHFPKLLGIVGRKIHLPTKKIFFNQFSIWYVHVRQRIIFTNIQYFKNRKYNWNKFLLFVDLNVICESLIIFNHKSIKNNRCKFSFYLHVYKKTPVNKTESISNIYLCFNIFINWWSLINFHLTPWTVPTKWTWIE